MTDPCGMGCEEAFDRLDDYVDRELSESEMEEVRGHLEECANCAREFTFEAEVLELVRKKVQRIRAPAGLRRRIAETLEREVSGHVD